MSIGKLIQDTAAQIPDSTYFRATDYNANTELHHANVEGKTVIIWNNLPVINYPVDGFVINKEYPITIRFLQLSDSDANTADEDVIREAMALVAESYLRLLLQADEINKAVLPAVVNITYLPQVYDAMLTGVELSLSLQMNPIC